MIFWKEYRQQRNLAVALFITAISFHLLVVLVNILSAWDTSRPLEVEPGFFYAVALVVSALYTTCSASIVYSNEQEEKTFSLLRNLPISRATLLVGKTSWVLLSAFAFLLLNLLLVLPMAILFSVSQLPTDFWHVKHWEPFMNRAYSWGDICTIMYIMSFVVFWHLFGCIFAPFSVGLFWSTRTKNAMNSIMATLGSTWLLWVMIWAAVCVVSKIIFGFIGPHNRGNVEGNLVTIFLIGSVLVIGVVALFLAYYWFDIWKDRKSILADFRPEIEENKGIRKAEYAMARDLSDQKRSEFWTLFLHAIRQSFGLFAWLFGLCGLTCLVMFLGFGSFLHDKRFNEISLILGLLSGVDILFLYLFAGNIFTADQKTQGAFLGDRGVSPRKVWWSRVLAFGLAYYAAVFAVFVSMCLSFPAYEIVTTSEYNPHTGRLLTMTSRDYSVEYSFEMDKWVPPFLIYTIPPFFAGIVASIFARSGIVATVGTMGLTGIMLIWGVLTQVYLGVFTFINGRLFPSSWKNPLTWWTDFTVLWCVLPIIIGLLLASRLRCADWLRHRSVWRSRRPVITCMVLPFFLICAMIPFYRIITIAKVDYGAQMDPKIYSKDFHYSPLEGDAEKATNNDFISSSPDLQTLRLRCKIVQDSYRAVNRGNIAAKHPFVENEAFDALDRMFPETAQGADETSETTTENHVSDEILDEAIEFMEKIQLSSSLYRFRVERFYEYNYYMLKNNEFEAAKIIRFLPWEKARMMRQLDLEFQRTFQFASETMETIEQMMKKNDPKTIESFLKSVHFSNGADNHLESRIVDISKVNTQGILFDPWASHTAMTRHQCYLMYWKMVSKRQALLDRLSKMKTQSTEETQPSVEDMSNLED